MRFGLWYDFRNPPGSGVSTPDHYRALLDQIVDAEAAGFDDIWLSEHHFVEDGYLPSCLPMAAAIAARTSRVEIGTNILVMPFHHPIRLAEDCAVVDNISAGRFILGGAVGYRLEEFATFGVDRRHRGSITEEAVQIVRRCFEEESFSFDGRHFQFEDVRCTPKPVHGTLPIWLGAAEGEAVRRAARLGDGLLGAGPQNYEPYLEALKEHGKDWRHPQMATVGRFVFVSEDPERDWERIKPHAMYQVRHYAEWFGAAGQPAFGDPPRNDQELEERGVYFVGTPDQIIEEIRKTHEAVPFERFFTWATFPGLPIEMSDRSVQLFAEHVIPTLRDLGQEGSGASGREQHDTDSRAGRAGSFQEGLARQP